MQGPNILRILLLCTGYCGSTRVLWVRGYYHNNAETHGKTTWTVKRMLGPHRVIYPVPRFQVLLRYRIPGLYLKITLVIIVLHDSTGRPYGWNHGPLMYMLGIQSV